MTPDGHAVVETGRVSAATAEPLEAFPYRPPSPELRQRYAAIFALTSPLPVRGIKRAMDVLVATACLLVALPILGILKLALLLEGIVDPSSRGPLCFSYTAVSAGRRFPKYKVRIIKTAFIDQELARQGDWHAYAGEWKPSCRTAVGRFAKAFYLDELPQLWNVLRGDMSLVGPRPLAVHHYERDIAQGNVPRALVKGGLLGLGHIRKGTPQMGDPEFEYEYVDKYLRSSAFQLLVLDAWVIARGLRVLLQGKGL